MPLFIFTHITASHFHIATAVIFPKSLVYMETLKNEMPFPSFLPSCSNCCGYIFFLFTSLFFFLSFAFF